MGRTKITMATLKAIKAALVEAEATLVENTIMHAAFRLVFNEKDWRGPIDKTVDMNLSEFETEVIAHAILYMTSTIAEISPRPNGAVNFKSVGYRMGPAGP